jgi:GWxTD domain-containing protein
MPRLVAAVLAGALAICCLEAQSSGTSKNWLNEDVAYIVSYDEQQTFQRLKTSDERQQFIEQFWLRRDPTPDTEENEYQEEHYRRIEYANEHYAFAAPGWKTDRGMIYILYGPPDETDSYLSSGETSAPLVESWHYRHIEGVGRNIAIEFVDTARTGDYKINLEPEDLLRAQTNGLVSPWRRFSRRDLRHLPVSYQPLPLPFRHPERKPSVTKAPAIQFKDLDAILRSNLHYNALPMQVRADYFRVTDATVSANIAIEFGTKAAVNLYGRISTPAGHPVSVFEWTGARTYSKRVPLAPGAYRLNIGARDPVENTMTTFETTLAVPHYEEDRLAASSVILADELEHFPINRIGAGPFIIRGMRVHPRFGDTFQQNETLGVYVEVYNLGMDEKTKNPQATIEYEVVNNASNHTAMTQTEDVARIPDASAFLVTIEKRFFLKSLPPGKYTFKLKLNDKLKNRRLTRLAQFTVTS